MAENLETKITSKSSYVILDEPKRSTGWFWRLLLGTITLLIVVGGFRAGLNSQSADSIPPVHEDSICRDSNGNRKWLNYSRFNETSPGKTAFVESFESGCSTLFTPPTPWGYHFHLEAGDDAHPHQHIYIKEPGVRHYRGPYDISSDAGMDLQSKTFYIQAAEEGVKIRFATDLVSP
jgi:hypothetical protein